MAIGTPEESGGWRFARSPWSELRAPARLLLYLLIALAVVEIYDRAALLVGHIFNVALLFVFASTIAVVLTPTVDRMQRVSPFRTHRLAAVITLYLGVLVACAGLLALVIPSLIDQAQQLPGLTARASSLVDRLQSSLAARGMPVDLRSAGGGGSGLAGSAVDVVTSTVTAIIDLLLVLVISIYLLTQGRELLAATRRLFPGHTHLFDFTLVAVGSTLGAYVRGQLIMSALMGGYIGISLTILGVHYAVLLGLVAALLEFLPLVGATVSMVLMVAVALLQSPTLAVLAASVGLGGHALDAYVVGPRVNAHVVRLHPLAAIAALLIGAEIGGILGALFAVPVAAIGNIFLGALYRSRRGDEPLSTDERGEIHADALPRLGEEISEVGEEGPLVDDPVPHSARDPQPVGTSGSWLGSSTGRGTRTVTDALRR